MAGTVRGGEAYDAIAREPSSLGAFVARIGAESAMRRIRRCGGSECKPIWGCAPFARSVAGSRVGGGAVNPVDNIAGYGCFADSFGIRAGASGSVGPNEGQVDDPRFHHGHAVRQKSSIGAGLRSRTLRAPWDGVEHYGGRGVQLTMAG